MWPPNRTALLYHIPCLHPRPAEPAVSILPIWHRHRASASHPSGTSVLAVSTVPGHLHPPTCHHHWVSLSCPCATIPGISIPVSSTIPRHLHPPRASLSCPRHHPWASCPHVSPSQGVTNLPIQHHPCASPSCPPSISHGHLCPVHAPPSLGIPVLPKCHHPWASHPLHSRHFQGISILPPSLGSAGQGWAKARCHQPPSTSVSPLPLCSVAVTRPGAREVPGAGRSEV